MSKVNFEKLVEESFSESDWSEFYHIDANEVVEKAFKAGYIKALEMVEKKKRKPLMNTMMTCKKCSTLMTSDGEQFFCRCDD